MAFADQSGQRLVETSASLVTRVIGACHRISQRSLGPRGNSRRLVGTDRPKEGRASRTRRNEPIRHVCEKREQRNPCSPLGGYTRRPLCARLNGGGTEGTAWMALAREIANPYRSQTSFSFPPFLSPFSFFPFLSPTRVPVCIKNRPERRSVETTNGRGKFQKPERTERVRAFLPSRSRKFHGWNPSLTEHGNAGQRTGDTWEKKEKEERKKAKREKGGGSEGAREETGQEGAREMKIMDA